MDTKVFFSIPEAAKLIGVSRIYLYEQVKNGAVSAVKIGRNYGIAQGELDVLTHRKLTTLEKEDIAQSVGRTVKEYGETLHKLGNT